MTSTNLSGDDHADTSIDLDYLALEMHLALQCQSMGRDPNAFVERMRTLPNQTVLAYANARYIVRLNSEPLPLKVGAMPPESLNAHVKSKSVSGWALIPAWDPGTEQLSTDAKTARRDRLFDLLVRPGCEVLSATAYSSHDEIPALLAIGVSQALAESLGRDSQQKVVVFGEADAPVQLVFCDKDV